jgi:ArsR family transcriptional regulator
MNVKQSDLELYQMHANICKTFTSPIRLMIIEQLEGGQKTVSEMEGSLDIRQATLSQHLAVLRERGIVVSQRQGQNIFYNISNPKILKACQLMKEVLLERIKQNSQLLPVK